MSSTQQTLGIDGEVFDYVKSAKLNSIPEQRAIVPLNVDLPAFVSHGSIQFLDLPEQQQNDSLYWTLFGQLAADAAYDRNDEPVKWIQTYIQVLDSIGLHPRLRHHNEYSTRITNHSGSSVDTIVLQHLKPCLSRERRDRLDQIIDALREEANANALSGFNRSCSNSSSANFQVSDGTVDHCLNLTIHVGFLYFSSNQKISNVLFWHCDPDVAFYYVSEILTLSKETADKLRETIYDRVNAQIERNVEEIPLD